LNYEDPDILRQKSDIEDPDLFWIDQSLFVGFDAHLNEAYLQN